MADPTSPLSSSSDPTLRTCCECGGSVRVDESIVLNGFPVCSACKPTVLARMQSGQPVGDAAVWRNKRTVVMGTRAVMPDRCVKCNAPAHGERLERHLQWQPSWCYLLIFLFIIPYLIASVMLYKTAKFNIGLCVAHQRARWMTIGAGWVLLIGGIAVMQTGYEWLLLVGPCAIVSGIIVAALGGRVIYALGISPVWIRFGGAGRPFLESLPEFPKP
jgi:hypothetical protein